MGDWENSNIKEAYWFKEKEKIKILGIDFHKTINETVERNMKLKYNLFKNMLHVNAFRDLTLHQRVYFVNVFAFPLFISLAQVYPIPKRYGKELQSLSNTFIWKGKHEQTSIEEQMEKIELGGLGLIDFEKKFKSLYTSNMLMTLKNEKSVNHGPTVYFLGHSIRSMVSTINIPLKENPPKILKQFLQTLKTLKMSDPTLDQKEYKTKDIYNTLMDNKEETKKIKEKNIAKQIENATKNINNKYIKPKQREHAYLQNNNILKTKERLKRCGYVGGNTCSLCPKKKTYHTYSCVKKANQP